MTWDPESVGWLVAGLLLVGSGLCLCVQTKIYTAGVLFSLAGILVGLTLVAEADLGVVVIALLATAIVAYPRFVPDLATALALAGAIIGGPALAWRVELAGVAFAVGCVTLTYLWWRLENARPETQGPLLWVLSTSCVVLGLLGVAAISGYPPIFTPVAFGAVGLVGVAALVGVSPTLRIDGRWFASRATAFAVAVACELAIATLVLTLITLGSDSPGIVALTLAAVGCGILWRPLLGSVQTLSDGALFGYRPDALSAAHRVAVSVGDDPAASVRAIQEGLALPYAVLALDGETPIEAGTPTEHRRTFPIAAGDDHIGDLAVGVRPGDLDLSGDDERVLTLAVPILVQTIKARSQTASLQRAREASASAREEERRRLRRDIHDGLGPRLTGIAFAADAAKLAGQGGATDPILDRIRREAETAINEIRELVSGLRPPALDELGLVGAISAKAESYPGLSTTIEAADVPELPAAVEVAAYRIAIEALTNVARHSGATRATVELDPAPDRLTVRVSDNGTGVGDWSPGIGLTSMRERASELGGTLTSGRTPTGGCVLATLPLPG
ncbi:MAG TPA: histidine kinase [Nocardioides sp.]|uniref:sensor histidine kinase n=1 Tax=uncultured Nocardioides sp. TaxID=198441 RepID=UPI000EEFB688|nr:histidine kinase [uncultured Nocardioides sp.]HCB04937.1 hypothetical protein [Nocardioides sp.]HRD61761.1 histidine kinase [Nocardioides sp.]HRI95312.1 histidine kinase [Nocardioides sp.]HRK45510.1 histidine kinase [Nocardioides sp.]